MKCFVISPIGQPGSPERNHADDVFECIIAPALEETGVTGHRADHVTEVGRITHQMMNDILTADFCLGVLHGHNPNVFYEIAVAHSAGIPVILMTLEGVNPPFDLKDERAFSYDLSPRAIHRGDNVRALVNVIEGLRRLAGQRVVPFGTNLTPLNGTPADGPVTVREETNAPASYWSGLVDGANSRLWLAGFGFTGWMGMQGMSSRLRAAAGRGVEVRVLTVDFENGDMKNMANPSVAAGTQGTLAQSVAGARAWFRDALGGAPGCEVRALANGSIFQQLIVVDDTAQVSPYLYSANTHHSPCLEVSRPHPIFETFTHEFDVLWDANAPKDS